MNGGFVRCKTYVAFLPGTISTHNYLDIISIITIKARVNGDLFGGLESPVSPSMRSMQVRFKSDGGCRLIHPADSGRGRPQPHLGGRRARPVPSRPNSLEVIPQKSVREKSEQDHRQRMSLISYRDV